MNTLILDAGALIAYERGDRATRARIWAALEDGGDADVATTGAVVAQVWRDAGGRQADLARLLARIDVHPVDERLGRAGGVLLGRTGTGDAVDGTLVAIAEQLDYILTSDPEDVGRLVTASGRAVRVVGC